MSERTKKFAEELDKLIHDGEMLMWAMEYNCNPSHFRKTFLQALDGNEKKLDELLKSLPNFGSEYQGWYSKAQALIKQVIPDRLADFISYFEIPKGRKNIDFQNYMIRDYLQGLRTTRNGAVIADGSAALPEFRQQVNMVKAARTSLDSTLMDLKGVLQADLFDSEVETADALAKAGYLRAAGAICGVVIEKHLHHICDVHNVPVRKKNPGISDLNQLLRDASVTTVPQWRYIQHLADIRNICDHAKGREPTKEEIQDLVAGTEKIVKTIF
ncbi:hypothetical protein SAMN05892877_1156 [Rhizobium subbaraonis]|uniref:HEPN domain-containing protein n=1 Tax=Rhizobium subbaraonis TaxID=908946 RepID=A0A285UVB9_9HYPH|nr:hypothetical protein [Rhizobium subbaraonis]SOC45328.1 hypothetical protein SAMN05892877_1156 [Rhizobium subbaraonis]